MTGKQAVANAFVQREEKHAGNIFTDGTTAYSYRFSYPIARHVDRRTVLVNAEQYSRTTSAHTGAIVRELRNAGYWEDTNDRGMLDSFDARVFIIP